MTAVDDAFAARGAHIHLVGPGHWPDPKGSRRTSFVCQYRIVRGTHRHMNRFDVQTIGWVITRDVCVEATRLALGARPRTLRPTAALLARAWMKVRRSMVADRFAESRTGFPLSTLSEEAVRAFLRTLISSYPGLYSVSALRDRCVRIVVRAIACVVCVYMIEHYSAASNPIAGAALAMLYLTASWSAVDLVQLVRAYVLIAHLPPF